MDDLADVIFGVFGDSSTMMFGLLVFLATVVLTLGVMLTARARGAVKRRAAGIAEYSGKIEEARDLRSSSRKAIARLLDYASRHYASTEKEHLGALQNACRVAVSLTVTHEENGHAR